MASGVLLTVVEGETLSRRGGAPNIASRAAAGANASGETRRALRSHIAHDERQDIRRFGWRHFARR